MLAEQELGGDGQELGNAAIQRSYLLPSHCVLTFCIPYHSSVTPNQPSVFSAATQPVTPEQDGHTVRRIRRHVLDDDLSSFYVPQTKKRIRKAPDCHS